MFLSKVSLIFWIVCGNPLYSLNMAQNYSDSDEEFTGFNSEDIRIDMTTYQTQNQIQILQCLLCSQVTFPA